MLDQVGAERPHRAVLLDRIAARHEDRRLHAVTARGECEALAVIAAGRRNQPGRRGPLALEAIDIDQSAAHLEGADRGVVLVLDDDRRAEPLRQQRPGMRRRRRHRRPDDLLRALELSRDQTSDRLTSHQRLAAGEGGGGGFVIGFRRQQHFIVRLAGGNHREAILQRRDPAIEQHRTLDRDHLLERAIEIAGLDGLDADAAEGIARA